MLIIKTCFKSSNVAFSRADIETVRVVAYQLLAHCSEIRAFCDLDPEVQVVVVQNKSHLVEQRGGSVVPFPCQSVLTTHSSKSADRASSRDHEGIERHVIRLRTIVDLRVVVAHAVPLLHKAAIWTSRDVT